MTLIDNTYFIRELYVPHIQTSEVKGDHMDKAIHSTYNTNLEEFIEEYEYVFLVLLLGRELANYFITHKEDEKFATLNTLLVNKERRLSPIANYVYVMWATNNQTQPTSTGGEIIGTTDYSHTVYEPLRQRRAWNAMVKMVEVIVEHIYYNRPLYLEYMGQELGKDTRGLMRHWNQLGI